MNRPTPGHRAGFVLVLTLVLLALAAVSLASIARQSVAALQLGNHVEAQVQRRWLVRSAEDVLLPRAEAILTDAAQQQRTAGSQPLDRHRLAPMAAERVLLLDGLSVRLRIEDEQAKLNLNHELAERDRQTLGRVVQELVGSSASAPRVRLRPFDGPTRTLNRVPEEFPALLSFGQVFAGFDPRNELAEGSASSPLSPARGQLPGVGGVTLWGGGAVRWERASAAVLAAALAPEFSKSMARRLHERLRDKPGVGLNEVAGELELTDMQLEKLGATLTTRSDTHSLWLVLDDGRRQWIELMVREGVAPATPGRGRGVAEAEPADFRTYRFSW